MSKGIDCASRLTARTAANAKAAGFDFVGRYLVPESYPKALTRSEAELIIAAGLRILTVWETSDVRVKGGWNAGDEDGKRAYACAKAIGMPDSGIIYFAVDYGAKDSEMETIAEYLRAARAQTGKYEIGVYGSYSVIEAMAARGVCRGYWQCCAWSYGKLSAARTVYQSDWSGTAAAKAAAAKIGVSVDLNDCPDMRAAGIWNYETEDEDVKRFNTINELPDWARDTVKKLCDREIIRGGGAGKDADGYPTDLDLSEDMARTLVWNDRAGLYANLGTEDDGR